MILSVLEKLFYFTDSRSNGWTENPFLYLQENLIKEVQRIKESKDERIHHFVDWDFIIENPSLTADDKYSIFDFKVDPNIVCCHKRQLIRLHLQHFTLSFVCLGNYVCIDVLKAAVCFLLSYKKNKHIVCCSSTEPGLFPVNPLLSSIHGVNSINIELDNYISWIR